MKKQIFYLTAALTALTMVFTACEKKNKGCNGSDDVNPSVINATCVVTDKGNIANVKALLLTDISHYTENGNSYIECHGYEVARAEYKNDGFILNLSKTVPDKYLKKVQEKFENTNIIIDNDAKLSDGLFIVGLNTEGKEFGILTSRTNNGDIIYINYLYADKPFTIKGEDNYGFLYDCSFEKGWNIEYRNETICTTQKPSDINLKWYFFEYFP